jgi:hypothetical protein
VVSHVPSHSFTASRGSTEPIHWAMGVPQITQTRGASRGLGSGMTPAITYSPRYALFDEVNASFHDQSSITYC